MKGQLGCEELFVRKYVVIQLQVTETQSKRGRFLAYGTEESKNCTASGMAGSRGSNDTIRPGLPPLLSLLPLPSPIPSCFSSSSPPSPSLSLSLSHSFWLYLPFY